MKILHGKADEGMPMFWKRIVHEKRTVQLYTLILFLALSVLFLMITLFLQTQTDQILQKEIEVNEECLLHAEKVIIQNKTVERVSDLLYITDNLSLSGMACTTDTAATIRQWIAFSDRKKVYDQIRFLDVDGNEVIRVNYQASGAYAVDSDLLQNKSDRYYFTGSITLAKDQVFISMLDLNIEGDTIEQPIKPMLRFATPYFSADGTLEGVVVLNYSAQEMLEQIASVAQASMGEMYLLNTDGYWLYDSQDSSKAWAFMYEDREKESFAQAYPEVWASIAGTQSGDLLADDGMFHYVRLDIETDVLSGETARLFCASDSIYIISFIPADSQAGAVFSGTFFRLLGRVFIKYLSIYFLLSGIAFVLAALLVVKRAQKKEIKYYSEFDAMTGVYNRRSGYQKLAGLQREKAAPPCQRSVCFLDINGLKAVNDYLGHEAGDELILTVIQTVKANVREKDFVARLGGDEFLIVFEGLRAPEAENVWARILQQFETVNANENREYLISVSHGIAAMRCGEENAMDTAIKEADALMYTEKREMKKNLHVVRGQQP